MTKKDKFKIADYFTVVAQKISHAAGTPWAFIVAVLSILIWLLMGEMFNYSNKWQLVINTVTTSVTFLMVFLIQNSQNRDSKSIELKLDMLLTQHTDGDTNKYIKLEDFTKQKIKELDEKVKEKK